MKEFNAEEVRIETASALETVRPAQVERQYRGYIGCLVHYAQQDESSRTAFRTHGYFRPNRRKYAVAFKGQY